MIKNTIKTRVMGVDISLQDTTYSIVDIRGNVLASESFTTKDHPNINEYVSVLANHIVLFLEKNGGYDSIRSIGVSVPSGNYMTGSIENASNLPWKGVIPLAALLRDRLGMAVAVANNAHVRALGEHTFGIAHGMKNFVVVTLGSGLGSCLYSNGVTHEGSHGFAGELGHTTIIGDGRQCGCGNKGCLETYCAAKGIIMTAHELMEQSDRPTKMREVEELTPEIIQSFCEEGDEMAIEVYRKTGYYLGWGLANYASIVNPEAFIVTGGITKAGHWLLNPTRQSFDEHVFLNLKGKVKILSLPANDLQRDVLGASVLAWQVQEYSLFK